MNQKRSIVITGKRFTFDIGPEIIGVMRLNWKISSALAFLLLTAFPAWADRDWPRVKSWVYQLTKYQDNHLDQIANAGFDLAVIDLSRDGKDDFFTRMTKSKRLNRRELSSSLISRSEPSKTTGPSGRMFPRISSCIP